MKMGGDSREAGDERRKTRDGRRETDRRWEEGDVVRGIKGDPPTF